MIPRSLLTVSALLWALGPLQTVAQVPPVRTTMDSVYTTVQAAEGREIYTRVCAPCHVLDYYTGEVVRGWEGVPIIDFYDLIRTKMPENNPGSLRSREYVAVLAYIMELNGMPPGDERLSARGAVLESIIFQWRDES